MILAVLRPFAKAAVDAYYVVDLYGRSPRRRWSPSIGQQKSVAGCRSASRQRGPSARAAMSWQAWVDESRRLATPAANHATECDESSTITSGPMGSLATFEKDAQRFLGLRVGIGRRCTCANDWSCRIRPFPARWPATVRSGRHTPASRHGYVGLLLMQLSAGQIRRSWPGKELGRDDAALARLGAGPNGR